MSGLEDAARRFSGALDGAVSRAKRAAADAKERGGAFRRQTGMLTAAIRAGEVRPAAGDVTPEDQRRAAVGFRTAQRLPVDELPPVAATPADPATPRPTTVTSATRKTAREPRRADDDEDFSQERILW
jgi:hypothetical protein